MPLLLRLLRYTYRYKTFTILAYICLLGSTGLALVQPLIIRAVFDQGIGGNNGKGDAHYLLVAAGLLLVVNIFNSLLNFGVSYLNEFVSQRVAYDLRNELYDHLQHLSFAYHDRAKTGELMSRVTSDVDAARIFTGQGVLQTINTIVLYVSIVALMFSLHWELALLALAVMPFVAFTAVQYGTRVRPLFSRMQRQWAVLTAVLQENITGVRVVKAFAREDYEIEKFEKENQDFLQRNIAATRLQALVYPLMLFITAIGTILIIWFGGRSVIFGTMSLGTLIAFNSYLMRLAQPTRQLGVIISWVSRASASGERLFEILDAPSPVENRPGALEMPPIEGRVVFEHVTFAYGYLPADTQYTQTGAPYQPAAERITDSGFVGGKRTDGKAAAKASAGTGNATKKPGEKTKGEKLAERRELFDPTKPVGSGTVLHDINLVAEPDQIVALIGHTGSGKSSLVSLIPRFYDVSEGAVLVDGHDVRDVQLQSLRRQIGIVLQESLLFSASVAENIAYGRPDATEDAILRAAKAAQAYEFIQELPEGLDTKIGERGVTLSGGQRQRLAIARALLVDPRILILDDATASVDMRTEFMIQEALQELMKGRTTFVIAQRLTTIKNADQILVLEGGRIVQRGVHDELVAQPGPYQQIYDLQLRDQEKVQRQMRELTGAASHADAIGAAGGAPGETKGNGSSPVIPAHPVQPVMARAAKP